MSSRVLTGARIARMEPLHLTPAFGTPVNTLPSEERPGSDSPAAADIDGALSRIHVLERRIHELESEVAKRYEMGRQAGLADGERAGEALAKQQSQPLIEKLARSIASLSTYPTRFRRDSEPELLKLSMAVARKILRRELNVDPHSLLGVLKAALESMNSAEILSVRLAAEDAAALSEHLDKIGLPQPVEVLADRTLERGAIIIETRRGRVDAGIQTQLAEIENGFIDRIVAHRTKS